MLIVKIQNDGTGTEEVANYDYEVLVNTKVIASGRVTNHVRKQGWTKLVYSVSLNGADKICLAAIKALKGEV